MKKICNTNKTIREMNIHEYMDYKILYAHVSPRMRLTRGDHTRLSVKKLDSTLITAIVIWLRFRRNVRLTAAVPSDGSAYI